MKPRPMLAVATVGMLVAVGWLAWLGRAEPVGPSVKVRFIGLGALGQGDSPIHRNPTGIFEVTNPGPTKVAVAFTVEAPNDANLMIGQALSSSLGLGELGPGEGRRMEAMVSAPGLSFRMRMEYTDPPSALVRLWLRAVGIESRLGRFWSPAPFRRRTEYGEWISLPTNPPVIR